MPRKQRFKPSRKPKVVGTPTDLSTTTEIEAKGSPHMEVGSPVLTRRDTDVFAAMGDVGGESS